MLVPRYDCYTTSPFRRLGHLLLGLGARLVDAANRGSENGLSASPISGQYCDNRTAATPSNGPANISTFNGFAISLAQRRNLHVCVLCHPPEIKLLPETDKEWRNGIPIISAMNVHRVEC
jgi:hypothetical protein